MKHASTLCSLGVALSAWGGVANASSGAIEVALEQRLRAERPDVLRWQLRAMSETAPVSDAAIAAMGGPQVTKIPGAACAQAVR